MTFSWSSISLENYAALHILYRYDATDKVQQDISALEIITGKPERYFETCSLTKLNRYREGLHKLLDTQIEQSKIESFRIGLNKFYCPDGIEFYFGEHLEGVSLLRINETNIFELYPTLLAVIASGNEMPFHEKVERFKKLPAQIGVSICDRFLSQLGKVAEKYDSTTEVKTVVKEGEPLRPDFRKQTVSMFEHWGYFHVFFELAGRDRTKMEYWRKQTIPYIFTSMAHRKDLQDEA